MADHVTLPAAARSPASPANGASSASARPVRPVRRLPGGRAVVGGLLVAVSAIGVFAAYTNANASPDRSYAVVRADVAAGQRLSRTQLGLVPLDLPVDQRRLAFTELDLLDGATVLAPMTAGQLVQSGDVAKPAGGPERAQISVALDPGRALGGDPGLLGPGERVAVIATFTQAGEPLTETVSADATIVRVLGGGDELGGSSGLTVVLAVPPGDLEPIAQATAAGVVTLARTTGLAPTGG
ncbi:MAG: hypothetical protein M3P97_05020 [Actinomycetota bacterium]|nr:hypothetical protein [Actinomycetota bacterium]